MDPVGAGGERHVEAIVHEEELPVRAADRGEGARELEQRAPAEVLLAQVDRARPGRETRERGLGARREVRREPAVGDQVDNGDPHP
jgi:hypothetical protein